MSLEMLLSDDDMHDCVVICQKDCAPVLAAMEKGSSRSAQLQEAAESMHRRANAKSVKLMMLHVSGKQLLAEGIDDGSRKHAAALKGPACGTELKELVREFAEGEGSLIIIDFFASAANAMAERYAAWTEDQGAELIDAFSSRSWDQGR